MPPTNDATVADNISPDHRVLCGIRMLRVVTAVDTYANLLATPPFDKSCPSFGGSWERHRSASLRQS